MKLKVESKKGIKVSNFELLISLFPIFEKFAGESENFEGIQIFQIVKNQSLHHNFRKESDSK